MRFLRGFWEIQHPLSCFHVTPHLRAIENYGGITSRAYRGDTAQTLGGEHDISISAYNNISMAKNTLLFLYRVWQRTHGELSDEVLKEKYGVGDVPIASSAQEMLSSLTEQFNSTYPVVGGDKWAADIDVGDMGIIEFINPSKFMFVNRLFGKCIDYISLVTRSDLRQLSRVSFGRSYIRGDEWLDSDFYGVMRSSLSKGSLFFSPSKRHISFLHRADERGWCDKVFGERSRVQRISEGHYKIGGFVFDFRDIDILFDSICEYDIAEDEIRIFRPIFRYEFSRVHTIRDIVEEATQRNGGREPLLWDKRFDK